MKLSTFLRISATITVCVVALAACDDREAMVTRTFSFGPKVSVV